MQPGGSTHEDSDKFFLSPPLAPPFNSYADTLREQYIATRPSNTPKYIYNLHTRRQEIGKPDALPQLVRSYVSSDLTIHDGACWLWDMHKKQGACHFAYVIDEEHKKSNGGGCYKFSTMPFYASKWGVSYSVWTTEELLY
jgi:hypothetical protein